MDGLGLPVLAAKARRQIVRDFVRADATAPDRAVPYQAADARTFARLRRSGVLREPEPGRFYLDALRLDAYRQSSRRKLVGLLAVLGTALGAVIATGE